MRNPKRGRSIALGFVVSGAVAAAVAATPGASDGMRAVLGIAGGLSVVIGAVVAGIGHRDMQAQAALLRGEGVLARWRVGPEPWVSFVAQDRTRGGPPYNELRPRDAVPPSGVEVIVGNTAILIGDSVHRLPVHGVPQVTHAALYEGVDPAVFELRLYHPGTGPEGTARGPLRTRLTFPVAVGALPDARRIAPQYSARQGEPDFFHGRGDGSDPEDLSKCWSCGFETHVFRSHCPQCGSSLQSRRWSRRFGIVLTILGTLMTGLMGVLGVNLVPMLLHPGQDFGGTRFAGGPVLAGVVLLILALVGAFGVTALCYGVWQVVTGKRNRRVVQGVLAMYVALAVVTGAMFLLG